MPPNKQYLSTIVWRNTRIINYCLFSRNEQRGCCITYNPIIHYIWLIAYDVVRKMPNGLTHDNFSLVNSWPNRELEK